MRHHPHDASPAFRAWVGNSTLYRVALDTRRAELHDAFLYDRLSDSESWKVIGANDLNRAS